MDRRTLVHSLLWLAAWLWLPAAANEWQPSDPPIIYHYAPPKSLTADQELVIRGENANTLPVILIIRCDDTTSEGYASRLNEERTLPPGPFTLRLALSNIKTPQGRHLNLQSIRELHVFTLPEQPHINIADISFESAPRLPNNSQGWDFGSHESAIFPGFNKVTPDDSRLTGKNRVARQRPGGDALISDGIQGIERFTTPLPNGRWHITLWIEDLGEWEYLPHPLQRAIKINDIFVLNQKITPQTWIKQRYLVGQQGEALLDGDPWSLFGKRRGEPIEADIVVDRKSLTIELQGDTPSATFISGILIEPSSNKTASEYVAATRRQRFNETWRTQAPPKPTHSAHILWNKIPQQTIDEKTSVEAVAAASTAAIFDLQLNSIQSHQATLHHQAPRHQDKPFHAELRWGQWSYQRPQAQSTLLELDNDNLMAYQDHLTLTSRLARRLHLRIEIPSGTPPGKYPGSLLINTPHTAKTLHYNIHVPAVTLPDMNRAVGVYLENLPFYEWFSELANERASAARCDLEYLKRLGLSSLAPPLTTPVNDGVKPFIADLQRAKLAGFTQPLLAYTPIKRLAEHYQGEALATYMARVAATLQAFQLPQPIWSIADEPSNPSQTLGDLVTLSKTLHKSVPGIRLAGHLNHATDRQYLPLFDVVLLNHGFHLSQDAINDVRAQGVEPWLYNLSHHRLAAGFYLWRIGANGYLQWHARMPTADPFDPTDGREADFYFLLPQDETCPATPNVRAPLFEIAEGITDYRWLRWLGQRSEHDNRAKALLTQLHHEIPERWEDVTKLDVQAAVRWRKYITDFAQNQNSAAKTRP
jgi:hypothetical protein